jgi:hypothetical protein
MEEVGTTLLDKALMWLDQSCGASKRLKREYDTLVGVAEAQVRAWEVRSDAVTEQIRNHETRTASARSVGILYLVAARFTKGIIEGHDTLAVILTSANSTMPKNDEVLVLASALLSALAVTIWCVQLAAARSLAPLGRPPHR